MADMMIQIEETIIALAKSGFSKATIRQEIITDKNRIFFGIHKGNQINIDDCLMILDDMPNNIFPDNDKVQKPVGEFQDKPKTSTKVAKEEKIEDETESDTAAKEKEVQDVAIKTAEGTKTSKEAQDAAAKTAEEAKAEHEKAQEHSASLLQAKEAELAQLNDKLHAEQKAKQTSEEKMALLNEALRTTQSEIDSLKSERDKANQTTQNLTEALSLKDAELAKKNDEVNKKTEELEKINTEKQSAISKITTLEGDLKATQQDKSHLEQKVSALDAKLQAQPPALKEPIIFTPPFFATHAEVSVKQNAKGAQFARDTAFACFDTHPGHDSPTVSHQTSTQSNAQLGLPLSARESEPIAALRLSHEQSAHDYAQHATELRAIQAQTFPFFVMDCALALWENFANVKYVCNQMVPGCTTVVEFGLNFISNTTAIQYFKSTTLSNSLVVHQTDIERAVWTSAHVALIFKGAPCLHMAMYGASKILTNMDELLMPDGPTFLSCLPDAVITGGLPGVIGGLPFGPVSIGASSLLLTGLQEINCLSGKNIKVEQSTTWWPVIADAAAVTFVTILAFLKPDAANHKFAFGMFALGFIVATDQFAKATVSLLSAQQHSVKRHKLCASIDDTFVICQNNHDEQPYLTIPKTDEKPTCMLQLTECCKVGTHKICPAEDGHSTIAGSVNNEHIETCVVHC